MHIQIFQTSCILPNQRSGFQLGTSRRADRRPWKYITAKRCGLPLNPILSTRTCQLLKSGACTASRRGGVRSFNYRKMGYRHAIHLSQHVCSLVLSPWRSSARRDGTGGCSGASPAWIDCQYQLYSRMHGRIELTARRAGQCTEVRIGRSERKLGMVGT